GLGPSRNHGSVPLLHPGRIEEDLLRYGQGSSGRTRIRREGYGSHHSYSTSPTPANHGGVPTQSRRGDSPGRVGKAEGFEGFSGRPTSRKENSGIRPVCP